MIQVGIIIGSQNDWSIMQQAEFALQELQLKYEVRIISAHRTPDRLWHYAQVAQGRGLKVIIAGAGGAAHLPGMVASKTIEPVIGVPIKTDSLNGLDSLYSIVQMPKGYPVATMSINGAFNAGLIAASILATQSEETAKKLQVWRKQLSESVPESP